MGERQRKDVNHKNSHSLISHWMCVWADSAPTHSVLRAFSFIRPYSSSVLLYSRKQQPTSGVLTHSFSLSLCMCFSLFIDFSYAAAAPHSGISAFISQWPRLYHRMVDTVHDDEISSVKFPLRICPQLSKCMGKLGTSEYSVCCCLRHSFHIFFHIVPKFSWLETKYKFLGVSLIPQTPAVYDSLPCNQAVNCLTYPACVICVKWQLGIWQLQNRMFKKYIYFLTYFGLIVSGSSTLKNNSFKKLCLNWNTF